MSSNFPDNKYPFNVRVYGICFNETGSLLVSDELIKGTEITKLPGGGLEYGEGPAECIIREFLEETGQQVEVVSHFYTTDFFVKSAFGNNQVISVYYKVRFRAAPAFAVREKPFDFPVREEGAMVLRWLPAEEILPDNFTFAIDKKVAELLRQSP